MGAGLAALPKLPQTKPIQIQPVPSPKDLVCRDEPDLSIQPLTADNHAVKGWVYVCAPIKNVGGQTWSARENAFTVWYSADRGETRPKARGFSDLAKGSTKNLCQWIKVPRLLRMGHDRPRFGECRVSLSATTTIAFGPDLPLDGNPRNDDCRSGNNKRTTKFNYMASCPW